MAETPPQAGEDEEELSLVFRGSREGIRRIAQHWAQWLFEPLPGSGCTLIEIGRRGTQPKEGEDG